jgi:hypothetical protein
MLALRATAAADERRIARCVRRPRTNERVDVRLDERRQIKRATLRATKLALMQDGKQHRRQQLQRGQSRVLVAKLAARRVALESGFERDERWLEHLGQVRRPERRA